MRLLLALYLCRTEYVFRHKQNVLIRFKKQKFIFDDYFGNCFSALNDIHSKFQHSGLLESIIKDDKVQFEN